MTKKPSTKRVMGALPPLEANSLLRRAMQKLPRMMPMISGRIYWTGAALCRPSAPAVSRIKQAMQKPMLTGFPRSTSTEAITPMTAPAAMMVVFSLFIKIPLFLDPVEGRRVRPGSCFMTGQSPQAGNRARRIPSPCLIRLHPHHFMPFGQSVNMAAYTKSRRELPCRRNSAPLKGPDQL